MQALEAKIPPPLVALTIAAIMWALARFVPLYAMPLSGNTVLAVALALLGAALALMGVVSFQRAQTTINPLQPEKATVLVTQGIYQRTRNPMYLGMLVVLTGWALWLGQLSAWAGLPLFVAFMNRFQIGPEERVLQQLFGATFEAWCRQTRRWL